MNTDKLSFPAHETNPMNIKKRLRNSIIDWLELNNSFFMKEGSLTVGEELVVALSDIFWIEVHKHKKKATENIQSDPYVPIFLNEYAQMMPEEVMNS